MEGLPCIYTFLLRERARARSRARERARARERGREGMGGERERESEREREGGREGGIESERARGACLSECAVHYEERVLDCGQRKASTRLLVGSTNSQTQ